MSWTAERARVASFSRHRAPNDPELVTARAKLATARAEMRAAQLEEHIARLVDEAPPLTPEQRDRIATLLAGGGEAA